jgi:hypothetical protein
MAAEYFDRGNILIKGVPVADLESGTIEMSNGFQDVITINKGYAGGSKGPVVGAISANRAVPRAGYASGQDLHDAVMRSEFVQFTGICGGKLYTVTGVPKNIRRGFGVTATAMEDVALNGSIEVKSL